MWPAVPILPTPPGSLSTPLVVILLFSRHCFAWLTTRLPGGYCIINAGDLDGALGWAAKVTRLVGKPSEALRSRAPASDRLKVSPAEYQCAQRILTP
jgi:hypothetical protein